MKSQHRPAHCRKYLAVTTPRQRRDDDGVCFSTAEFRDILKLEGIESVVLPPKSPNLNAHLERFFRSLKSECLDRMIFFGEDSLRKATKEFLIHYHSERNHQGLENKLIEPAAEVAQTTGMFECRERLGGLLNYYHRRAA